MIKKQLYTAPQTEVFELSYAEPVCQATSGEIPDYDYNALDPEDLFGTIL